MVFSSIQKGNEFWNNKRSIHANKHQNQIHQNGVFPRGGINLTQALTIAVHSTAAFRHSIFGIEMLCQSTRRHPCTHRVSTPSWPRPRCPAPFLAALLSTNETLFSFDNTILKVWVQKLLFMYDVGHRKQPKPLFTYYVSQSVNGDV